MKQSEILLFNLSLYFLYDSQILVKCHINLCINSMIKGMSKEVGLECNSLNICNTADINFPYFKGLF